LELTQQNVEMVFEQLRQSRAPIRHALDDAERNPDRWDTALGDELRRYRDDVT
jgi:hypothetical protein